MSELPPTLMDGNGYPAGQSLDVIRAWEGDFAPLLEFVRRHWHWPNYFRQDGRKYELRTGGWSGNEELIAALEGCVMFWMFCWQSSERGGRYVFEVPELLK